MSTTLVQVKGPIVFQVTDLELAFEIKELIKEFNSHAVQPVSKVHNGNGRAKKDPETKDKIQSLLKERYSSNPFNLTDAIPLVKGALGISANIIRRTVKMGIEKGVHHFLGLASIPHQATGAGR